MIQEEFDRYVGLWWCPTLNSNGNPLITVLPHPAWFILGEYSLIYEKTDTNGVSVVKLPSFDSWSEETEEHAYPKPGSKNATSDLVLVTFRVDKQTYEVSFFQLFAIPLLISDNQREIPQLACFSV